MPRLKVPRTSSRPKSIAKGVANRLRLRTPSYRRQYIDQDHNTRIDFMRPGHIDRSGFTGNSTNVMRNKRSVNSRKLNSALNSDSVSNADSVQFRAHGSRGGGYKGRGKLSKALANGRQLAGKDVTLKACHTGSSSDAQDLANTSQARSVTAPLGKTSSRGGRLYSEKGWKAYKPGRSIKEYPKE